MIYQYLFRFAMLSIAMLNTAHATDAQPVTVGTPVQTSTVKSRNESPAPFIVMKFPDMCTEVFGGNGTPTTLQEAQDKLTQLSQVASIDPPTAIEDLSHLEFGSSPDMKVYCTVEAQDTRKTKLYFSYTSALGALTKTQEITLVYKIPLNVPISGPISTELPPGLPAPRP
jgi:hypothetical protein